MKKTNINKVGIFKKNLKKKESICLVIEEYNISHNDKHNFLRVLCGNEIVTVLKNNIDFK